MEKLTTFGFDFTVADKFGIKAIKDTYKRAIRDAKCLGYKAQTELYIILNWKIWEHWEKKNYAMAKVYDVLWKDYYEKLRPQLAKSVEFAEYFYETMD